MAMTTADIDALDAAIASGASKVRFADGREITYRSLAEMLTARSRIVGLIAGTPPGGPATRTTLVTL